MSQNPSKPPPYRTSSETNQTAGDNATQIGQVYGNVILNQFQRHPSLLYLVLFLAIVDLCVITWRIAPLIGVQNGFLNFVGETIFGVAQPTPTPFEPAGPPIASPTPIAETNCITTSGLNVRAGPGTSFAVSSTVPAGTNLKPIARNSDGSWVRIEGDNISGWVSAAFVNCDGIDLFTLPEEDSTPDISQPILTQEPSGQTDTQCVITITNPLVDLKKEPNRFSQDLIRVPPGQYSTLEYRIVQNPLEEESWFQIQVGSRIGWVENNTWTIASKTDLCP